MPSTTCWPCRWWTRRGRLHGIVTADDALDKIIPTAWKKRLPSSTVNPKEANAHDDTARRFRPICGAPAWSLITAVVGPGIITANVDNDAGGITTYSVAGAHYGYSLLWMMPLVPWR